MITIKNTQRAVACNTKQLHEDAEKIMSVLGYEGYDLGIWLTTLRTIQRYNATYRAKDKPTDILSFPFYPELKPGSRIAATSDDEKNLGDLIIAPMYVERDAQKLGVPFEKRMRRLLIHGICHLLGHDHETDEEYAVMLAQEQKLWELLGETEHIV